MGDLEYGQQEQMEDPSMEGTLRTQAEMIWPLEQPLLERLGLGACESLADLGCGTGQFAGRAATAWPHLSVVGLDLFQRHVDIARATYGSEGRANLRFEAGDARATGWDAGSVDVVAVRHMLHALPDREAVVAEAQRILKPGGLLYLLVEDYAGLIFDTPDADAQRLFMDAQKALVAHGTDLFHGRRAFGDMRAAGFEDVRVDPLLVDTSNTDRETFAQMLEHWRDGYADFIADAAGLERPDVVGRFNALIEATRDPERYGCWLLWAVSGRTPSA